jgi:primary-amine oxidase
MCAPAWADHPLDPLTPEEMNAARAILRASGHATANIRFPSVALDEPPKADVLRYHDGDAFPRRAFAVAYDRSTNSTFEAVIDLRAKTVVSWKNIPGVQPAYIDEDYGRVQRIVRSDPAWRAAIAKRGITDLENVQVDPWAPGYYGLPEEHGQRIFRAVAYYKGHDINAYAKPIEGLFATVDVSAGKILKLTDTGVVPVTTAASEYGGNAVPLREAAKPLIVQQPDGASFTVSGHEIRWQKWRFRYGFHPREGLVLYTVGYEDGGRVRSILYRASLSEMVVPYGDASPDWFFRNAFDEGEYGLGRTAAPLEPLNDAPANAVFFDAIVNNDLGQPVRYPRLAALYERDGGILWKHRDEIGNRNESRRARDLVLTWIATVGNYDYGFNWIFHQDGTLEMEVDLSGIMLPKGVAPDAHSHSGHKVEEGVIAVHHQHFFNFRLDMDVDSAGGNSVVELNTESLPEGPGNPNSNAFVLREDLLKTESRAQRMVNLASSRAWKIVNPLVKNTLGEPVGYMLVPGENAIPYAHETAWVRKRAGFLNAHLWVTPYEPAERYAAGDYICQGPGGEGLVKWTKANRPIENTDVVVWYTMGVTHIPRPEEWPVMPVHRAGFKLIPAGFFTSNPALDVPKLTK